MIENAQESNGSGPIGITGREGTTGVKGKTVTAIYSQGPGGRVVHDPF